MAENITTAVEEGSATDKEGNDAYLRAGGGMRVQVKTDETLERTRNLYIELYEKTVGFPGQKWRHSPADVQAYIFVTVTFAVFVGVDALAGAIAGHRAVQISPTSIGFLIPVDDIPDDKVQIKTHNYWSQHLFI